MLAAHEATKFKQSIENASGYNLVENTSLELNNAIVFNPSISYALTNKIESYFGQLNYDYNWVPFVCQNYKKDGFFRFIKR